MNNIKFTGVNIAAAVLILFYFFPWAGIAPLSFSGFSVTTNAVSPGMMAYFITGFSRFFMILAILVPASGAIILYQNITGNKKFEKFYKPAFIIPAVYLIIGIVGLYFKMKPDAPSPSALGGENSEMFNEMSRGMRDMAPGAFDVLSFGIYISLAAAIYLLLVSFGKIKDKEYYKPTTVPTTTITTDNKDVPGKE